MTRSLADPRAPSQTHPYRRLDEDRDRGWLVDSRGRITSASQRYTLAALRPPLTDEAETFHLLDPHLDAHMRVSLCGRDLRDMARVDQVWHIQPGSPTGSWCEACKAEAMRQNMRHRETVPHG